MVTDSQKNSKGGEHGLQRKGHKKSGQPNGLKSRQRVRKENVGKEDFLQSVRLWNMSVRKN